MDQCGFALHQIFSQVEGGKIEILFRIFGCDLGKIVELISYSPPLSYSFSVMILSLFLAMVNISGVFSVTAVFHIAHILESTKKKHICRQGAKDLGKLNGNWTQLDIL